MNKDLLRNYVCVPHHPRNHKGQVRQSIIVAEKALGKILPEGAIIHHVNGDVADDRPRNLVICENQSYHQLLHMRARAIKACSHATWRKCQFCGEWDDPENLYIPPKRGSAFHRVCHSIYEKARKERKVSNV